jgi:hypothetical protein
MNVDLRCSIACDQWKSRFMPTASPGRSRTQTAQDFSLVSLVRAHLQDCELKKGEGDAEMEAVAAASKEVAKFSTRTMRGHCIPMERAESGGINTGSLADGGALVSGSVSLAAALQPVLMMERLGARRVSLLSGDLLVSAPAVAGGGWVTEDADSIVETALFGAALRQPKEAAARLKMSRRLFNQSAISEQEFRLMLQRTISATIVESGILAGTGSNGQPMGLLNDPQLNQETFTSADSLPSRARVAELVGEILENGGDLESVRILLSASDYESSQLFVASASGDAPKVEIYDGTRRMAGVPCAFSPYVPTGNVIMADWSRVSFQLHRRPATYHQPIQLQRIGLLELTLFQMVGYAVERRELLTVAKLAA